LEIETTLTGDDHRILSRGQQGPWKLRTDCYISCI